MAIAVDGYGNITKGNAKEIYVAWKRGEVELNKLQQTKCESFLSPEEIDEVQYDVKTSEKTGKDKINTEGTEKKTGGNAAATTVGNIAAVAGAVTAANTIALAADGFTQWAIAIGMNICAASTLLLVKAFDNAYKERTAARDASDQTNTTLDNYNDGLANSMEMMNEDIELYGEQQDKLTTTVNTQVSQGADLQMQYDAAVAMGDTNGAQALKEQMKTLSEQDNSQLEDELAETGEGIEEYRAMNAESIGCAESGQSVSDFLKEGTTMGALGVVNSIVLTLGAAVMGFTAAGTFPKLAPFFPDLPLTLTGKVVFGIAAALFAKSAKQMMDKSKAEFECASAGGDMQEHVNSLNEMISQQDQYTTETEGAFAESDEAAAESQAEAEEAAGDAVSGNREGLSSKPKDDKEDKPKPAPAPTGAAA